MHPNSLKLMSDFFEGYLKHSWPGRILDVGSKDVNGSYRRLVPEEWEYTGLDPAPGPNVDVIAWNLPWPFSDEEFQVVISGQCLEHAERPWEVVREIGRVLAPGGYCCLIAPWRWDVHRYPLDCWRVLPDGMEILLALAGCEVLAARIDQDDCIGVGIKKGQP